MSDDMLDDDADVPTDDSVLTPDAQDDEPVPGDLDGDGIPDVDPDEQGGELPHIEEAEPKDA
jgi:hypothetical protein